MKGVVFLGNRQLEIRDFPDPTPGPGEVVLQIKASGMCGSDLKFYRSANAAAELGLGGDGDPIIGGHEPCGVVAEVGPGVNAKQAFVGQRVMDHHYYGCGVCKHCRQGWSQLCGDGFVVYGVTGNGAHADYMKVPAATLVPLPDELSFAEGAAVSCGTGTAYNALRRMHLVGGTTMAVFGPGPVGLSATMLGPVLGVRVIAVDIGPERLELAKQFGAEHVINAKDDDPVKAIKELTGGEGVDYALECSGSPDARLAAVQGARTWGTVCFVGEGQTVTLDVSRDMIRKQITLLGSWTFNTIAQADCARFVAANQVPVEKLFTQRYKLDQAADAYRLFDTQTTGKGVFLS
jgi:threonine dehydrogenase-like Zn-dependent dehydrogenase